jgi:hypothetical protein
MFMKKLVAMLVLSVGGFIGIAHAAEAPTDLKSSQQMVWLVYDAKSSHVSQQFVSLVPTVFRHGDCSWVEPVALEAGWRKQDLTKLIHIIKRESGCCPRRIGGSVVDKNCNTIRMATWKHPSDSGLLQINGVHWKQDHAQYHGLVCERMGVCTQEPLLDPLTNLKAGRLLFEVAGWSPWRVG